MCLQSRLDNIQWTSDNTGEAARRGTGQHLEGQADVTALAVHAGPGLELLPEHELQGREGEVAGECGLIAIEEGRGTLSVNNGARGVNSTAIVVAGAEVRVVVAALQLQACLEDFRRDVYDGRGEVAQEPYVKKREMLARCGGRIYCAGPSIRELDDYLPAERYARCCWHPLSRSTRLLHSYVPKKSSVPGNEPPSAGAHPPYRPLRIPSCFHIVRVV